MTTWKFLNNTFITIAEESRPRAISILHFTDNALLARLSNPFFAAQSAILHPLRDAVDAEEASLTSQVDAQKGSTLTLDQLFELLSPEKINAWDRDISNVYLPGTPQYVTLLGHGHKPFQTGKKDDRINAVKSLGLSLTGIVALAALKIEVDNFYNALKAARDTQQGKISTTKTDSSDLSANLIAAMTGMYAFLGAGINHFASSPHDLEPLFDLEAIQNKQQTKFTLHISENTAANIAKRTLADNTRIRTKVNSTAPIKIAIMDEKNDTNPTVFKIVGGLEEETDSITALRQSPTSTYIKAFNEDGTVIADVEIEIL